MIQIHSDFFGIQRHFDECFEEAGKKNFKGEPWQFVLPLANLPDPIHFSSDEMGMLLALKNDDVFNLIASLDVVLNGLSAAFGTMNSVRRELGQRIKPDAVVGQSLPVQRAVFGFASVDGRSEHSSRKNSS
jgi:hypothetical protein